MRYISTKDIQEHLPMRDAIALMGKAFALFTEKKCVVPPRMMTSLPNTNTTLIYKPAYIESINRVGIKLVTSRIGDKSDGLPAIQGLMLLIDGATGEFLAMMDGALITALRTGAASGIATELLARKDASVLALFGCGAQGRTQLEAVSCVRNLNRVFVYSAHKSSAHAFQSEVQQDYAFEIIVTDELKYLQESDIICTATPSTKPLFKREHVRDGVHVNAIGSHKPHMQELDPAIVRDSRLFVDSIDDCLRESGDIIKPLQDGVIDESHILGEIGSVVQRAIPGRLSNRDITIFKSVGVAIQDLVAADEVYRRISASGHASVNPLN
jgi:ornithine cyclodeaminase/alanine dehydrogenase